MKHAPHLDRSSIPAACGMSAADYVRLLHPAGSRGKVSFVLIRSRTDATTQTYVTETAPFIAETLVEESTYVTLNRFHGPRNGSRLAQINALYLDLDVHRLPGSNLPPAAWAERFRSEFEEKTLPFPSILISTGRGLAAVWLLQPVPAKVQSRWSATMGALIGLFRHMGADTACSDCARIFRLPGTTNLKAGRVVHTIGGTLRRYDFDGLADQIFLAAGRPTRRELTTRKLRKTSPVKPGSSSGLSPRRRFSMIQRDLDRIVAHWGGCVPEGRRNIYLHLIATCLTHTGPAEEIEQKISCIAAIATPGLSEREIAGIIKSAERQAQKACSSIPALDGRLHYSGARIADLLSVSDDLARNLNLEQVFSDKERARRKACRERERRRAAGATSREEWLAENSASREKPWKKAGISRTSWYRKRMQKGDAKP